MKKDLGLVQAVYPMPVLMVAAYDENEKVNVMNVAWGQICDEDKIILFIGEGKRTWLNIQASKAFTVALADEAHVDVADFFGIASGNRMADKFERSGFPHDIVNVRDFPVSAYDELKLRIILDRYSLELFVNDGEQAASFVLYTPVSADSISFSCDGAAIVDVEKYDIEL